MEHKLEQLFSNLLFLSIVCGLGHDLQFNAHYSDLTLKTEYFFSIVLAYIN